MIDLFLKAGIPASAVLGGGIFWYTMDHTHEQAASMKYDLVMQIAQVEEQAKDELDLYKIENLRDERRAVKREIRQIEREIQQGMADQDDLDDAIDELDEIQDRITILRGNEEGAL